MEAAWTTSRGRGFTPRGGTVSRARAVEHVGDPLFAIGLTVMMDILIGGPFTGAAMNPARAFGPALAAKFWTAHGVYWVGPLFGGALAGALYDALYLRKSSN